MSMKRELMIMTTINLQIFHLLLCNMENGLRRFDVLVFEHGNLSSELCVCGCVCVEGGKGGARTKGLLDVLIQVSVCGATTLICGRASLRTGFVALDIRLDALANWLQSVAENRLNPAWSLQPSMLIPGPRP